MYLSGVEFQGGTDETFNFKKHIGAGAAGVVDDSKCVV
jgi:hypothetical protein